MCKLCDEGKPQQHDAPALGSRRDFLKASSASAAAAAGASLLSASVRADNNQGNDDEPGDSGKPGRRYILRGGAVMSMDPAVGDFPQGDVLVEGKKILAVGANLQATGAQVIDCRGKIVMPGFIDTHHHQFETVLRSFLADGVLIKDNSNSASGTTTYFEYILLTFAPVYRPQDVYINELFGGLSQIDAGVTTVHDVSQIHHSPQHSDAAIQALFDTGRRAAFGYFESAGASILGTNPGNKYPFDAPRIKKQWFSSTDQLVTMIMGGEVYINPQSTQDSWTIGRQLDLQIAAHILSPFGIRPTMDDLCHGIGGSDKNIGIGSDNLFIHMTGMSDFAWQKVHDVGAQVSIAFPIEMNMRHGMPPVVRMQSFGGGFEPSLSVDVECTLTADFFTQMRSAMNLQRMIVNQMILDSPNGNANLPDPLDWGLPQTAVTVPGNFPYWPTPPAGIPAPLTTRDVLRYATVNGAKALRLDKKVGSLTPGYEADIIVLDAQAINVAPLNQVPGAVVSLMDRSNVETVIVAGKILKWKGKLQGVDIAHLRTQLENSRDYVFSKAGVPKNLFSSQ
jgi:cytosine/adenosine deaminase-related metal-dependent hydrolase